MHSLIVSDSSGKMTRVQVEEMYKSPLNRKEGYQPLLKCKVNTVGNNAIHWWDSSGELTDEPTDWKTTKITPQLCIRNMWLMGGNFGWVIEVSDCQVFPHSVTCPFARLTPPQEKESFLENDINNEEEDRFPSDRECHAG